MHCDASFWELMVAWLIITFFWNVTPCHSITENVAASCSSWPFQRLKIRLLLCLERPGTNYLVTQRHIPEERNPHVLVPLKVLMPSFVNIGQLIQRLKSHKQTRAKHGYLMSLLF
jgi:hypothetical protein